MTGARPSIRRVALVLVALVAGASTVLLLGLRDASGDLGLLAAKRDLLASQDGAYDTLFVGSSRVYRNIDPLHFDAIMQREGRTSHAFNLGLPGMSFLEALFTAHALLDGPPARLRRLVVELLPPTSRPLGDNARSERVRAWHDPRTTLAAARLALADEGTLAERIACVIEHLRLGSQRALHVAEGHLALRALLSPAYDEATSAVLPTLAALRGHLPLEEDPDPLVAERRAHFVREVDAHLERTRVFAAGSRGGEPSDAVALELLADLARHAATRDVQLVLVGMPVYRRFDDELRAASQGRLDADVISLANPGAYPEFYAPERRFDANHLDREGTRMLTEALAERIAGLPD